MEGSPTRTGSSRRRITRTGLPIGDDSTVTIASISQAGPSRLPELTQLVDVGLSDLEKSSDDLESDDHSTPRIPASSKLPPPDIETPAARLRALINRVPNGSFSSTTPVAPRTSESVIDYESDFDQGESIDGSTATPSMAQNSLRSVFSHALRAPGDTPQKSRRRNSIDSSEVDASPRVEKERSKNKGKRKSLSDEEVENSYRTSTRTPASFKSRGQPLNLEVLRQRYMNSRSEIHGDDIPSSPGKHDMSDDTADLLRELNSSRTSPPMATSTPQHSLRMSVDSQYQMQSNLLDHDSEMQRAIEGLDSYEDQPVDQPVLSQQFSSTSHFERTVERHVNTEDGPSIPTKPSASSDHDISLSISATPDPQTTVSPKYHSPDDPTRQRERLWSFPKSPARPITPQLKREISRTPLLRESSLTARSLNTHNRTISSPRLSNASSSRSGSISSQAEYRERINELDHDRRTLREREWNKPTSSRPASSLSSYSPRSAERPRTQSLASSGKSPQSPHLPPTVLQALRRHHSFGSSRGSSPTNSAHGSQEEIPEVVHERERNWNSPRPVWQPKPKTPTRTRTDSVSSIDTVPDDSYHPPLTTSRIESPRTAGGFSGQSRKVTQTPDSPSSPRNYHSPRVNGRHSLPPVSSPSIRRPNSSLSTSRINASPDATRLHQHATVPSPSQRSSVHSPSKSLSNDKSTTVRAPKPSRIPALSPRKAKSSSVRSIHDSIQPSLSPQEYLNEGIQPQTKGDLQSEESSGSLRPSLQGGTDVSPQELTPTQQTVLPPPSPQPSPSSPLINPSEGDDQERDNGPSSTEPAGSDAESTRHIAPPNDTETPSFLLSPPRHTASNTKLDFKSPSPPKGLPELPGPPSTDDESEDESAWASPPQARLFVGGSASILKTPKPPGGWMDTPAPIRRHRAYSDSMSLRGGPPAAQQPPSQPDLPNLTAMQTPRPPGGWLATPAPRKAKVEYADQSVETDTEPEADDLEAYRQQEEPMGLATPVSSLSKAAHGYAQTPAAPGAWIQTPAARKSITKVRFNPQASETREFTNGETDVSGASESLEGAGRGNQTQTVSPPASPEISAPLSPSRPPRKAPSIRILDAYGNETRDDVKAKDIVSTQELRRTPVRIVDALGHSAEEESIQQQDKSEDVSVIAGNRDEILSRVRQGLDELVQEIHELDQSGSPSKSNLPRIKELDSISLSAREGRRHLSRQLQSANDELKERFGSLRAGMQKAKISPQVPNDDRRLSKFRVGPSMVMTLLILQVLLAIVMYRVSVSRARDMFLTTYYDPFNPDLHHYINKSRIFLSSSSTSASWLSILDLLRRHGLKASVGQILDNLSIALTRLQNHVWERWGGDLVTRSTSWPPT